MRIRMKSTWHDGLEPLYGWGGGRLRTHRKNGQTFMQIIQLIKKKKTLGKTL